jgi:hypothetical protein
MSQTPSAENAAAKNYNGIFFFGRFRKITSGIFQGASATTRITAGIFVCLLALLGLISCGNSRHFYRDLNAQDRAGHTASPPADQRATPAPSPSLTQKRLGEDETYQRLIWEMNHPSK